MHFVAPFKCKHLYKHHYHGNISTKNTLVQMAKNNGMVEYYVQLIFHKSQFNTFIVVEIAVLWISKMGLSYKNSIF